MMRKARVAYFVHSLRSDWNNGNAHFLRGLLRELGALGHSVTIFEPEDNWSLVNLRLETRGVPSLRQFDELYGDLSIETYNPLGETNWLELLDGVDVVILHEWNPPDLAHVLLKLRNLLHFALIFHDTHHRASSSPQQIALFGVQQFDGVLAFGEVLTQIYRNRFGVQQAWTLHEAADTRVFQPSPRATVTEDVVWIGNWGDDERSGEIKSFLLIPSSRIPGLRAAIYGVRYPESGLAALAEAGVNYGGYLPNLEAPAVYAASRLTVHIPRQAYASAMVGIPTIRVFEALACGIPLVSAPWRDSEGLFRQGDFLGVRDSGEMRAAMEFLLGDQTAAHDQAMRGLETVLARHTCHHRAVQLSAIIEEQVS